MKYEVIYSGGESRGSNKAVDYMLAMIEDIELYAEATPVEGDETGTYDSLKKEIVRQAMERGVNPRGLKFMYD